MVQRLAGKRVAIIGVGKLGEALVRGLIKSGLDPRGLLACDHLETRREHARRVLGVEASDDPAAAAAEADIVVLAVKPHQVASAVENMKDAMGSETLLISVAASVTTGFIEQHASPGAPVVRVMPNTPCLLGEGMTVLTRGAHAGPGHLDLAEAVFGAVGRTAVLGESLMDAVTGLSGSGPAYIYVIIESLAEAGVKMGIPRDVATLLASQTTLGAAKMAVELGEHPALLKDMVTTPAGCTVDGLLELEEGGLRVTLIKAVVTATRRAGELVDG